MPVKARLEYIDRGKSVGWIEKTMRQYPWADFCVTCGQFVAATIFGHRDHVVVRRTAVER